MSKFFLSRYPLPIWIPLIAVVLRVASPPTAGLSFFVLAAYALTGRVQAIQAMVFSWLFSMLNPALVPTAGDAAIGRYAVILSVVISVFRLGFSAIPPRVFTVVQYTLLIGLGLVLHSVFFSTVPDVSLLKAISWLMAICSLILAWAGLKNDLREKLSGQMFTLVILVLLVSLPFLASPAGYRVNGTGFQGVLGHPQAFGTLMGLLGVWTASQIISAKKPSFVMVVFFLLSVAMIFKSEARTGALSLALGLTISLVSVSILSGRSLRALAPGLRSGRFKFLLVSTFVGLALSWSSFSDQLGGFISKRTDSTSIAEAYEASRGRLMEAMWDNIAKDSLIGIGFGIGSVPEDMVIVRDPVLGLPVSAIIEKGVLPLAILEELGIFGFVGFALWFASIIIRSSRGGLAPLAVCLTALLQNMGDSMFFSASGMGMILLVLVSWSATSSGTGEAR